MKKYIIIEADTNDADYITSKNVITEEQFEQICIVVEAIKKSPQEHNWETSEYGHGKKPSELYKDVLTQKQIQLFDELVPHEEYGIHTIESIKVLEVVNEINLF